MSRRLEIKYSVTLFSSTRKTSTDNLQFYTRFDIDIHSAKCLVSLQEVYVHILDLSETKKVWEFAEGFKRKYKSLNVLVSNMLVFGGGLSWQLQPLNDHILICFRSIMRVSS